jgi:hypothetical protein
LYREVRDLARDFHQKYVQIQPWVLVACSLWAILHDRTAQWATDEANWRAAGRLRPFEAALALRHQPPGLRGRRRLLLAPARGALPRLL